MTPSALSSGIASLVAIVSYGIDSGEAYVPPTTNVRSFRSGEAGTVMASMASNSDAGSSRDDDIGASTINKPLTGIRPFSNSPYIRIQKRGRHYDVQTAITTFQKTEISGSSMNNPAMKTLVDLHAQIHFGDSSYFQYFNHDVSFSSKYDKILYELIVEDKFLTSSTTTKPSTLKQLTPSTPGSTLNPIGPTQSDRNTASQYGLQCQVDSIQYCREGWVHADLTREEFLGWLDQGQTQQQQSSSPLSPLLPGVTNNKQPLWALASTSATYPGSELVTSLLRPLTTTSVSAALTRRLFTHLFLPGDALSGWIRAILWFGVPSPELSIMLVDWSSLSYGIGGQSRRGGGGAKKADGSNNIAPISPIAAPVFLSLLTGNWGTARRLVFGQVLVGGQSNSDTSKQGVLIDKRNERAMEVLQDSLLTLEQGNSNEEDENVNRNQEDKRIALLYGAGHCRDLHRRLIQEEGMTPIRTEWRTAFRATAPRWGYFADMDDWKARSSDFASSLPSSVMADGEGIVKSMSVSTLESIAVGLVVLPLYLLVGGLDWVSTMGDLGNALGDGKYIDGLADVLLYLVRHAALYVGISKFVVDWGGNEGIFEEDERAF